MKPSFLILFLLMTCACSPDFHKQKYTNFGHGKPVKLKTDVAANEETKIFSATKKANTVSERETTSLKEEVVEEADFNHTSIVHDSLTASCSFQLASRDSLVVIPEDSLKVASAAASDSLSSELYSLQLRREGTRNLMLGAAEITIGVLALFLLTFGLPVLIIHAVVGIVFILVASHKIAKARSVLEHPERYKNPAGNYRIDKSVYHLSHIGYILLLLSILIAALLIALVLMEGTLLFFILALVAFYVIPVPLALIALILLVIAGLKGRNHVRKENLEDLEPENRVKWYNAINWSLIAIAFTSIVVGISSRFKP